LPARPETPSPTHLPDNDAMLDRLCQTLVGWTDVALQSEIKAFQARYTLAFATIGFGGAMATILGQGGMPIRGFLFLLCMAGFALELNFHYGRKCQAWSRTREVLEDFSHIVSYHRIRLDQSKSLRMKRPHEIWRYYDNQYAKRQLDLMSGLFLTIAMVTAHPGHSIRDDGRELR